MKSTMRFLTTITLVCVSMTVHAADDFDLKVANIDILRDKNVQKDMGVTESQRSTMNGYADKFNKAGQAKIAEYEKAKKKPDQAYFTFAQEQLLTLRKNILNSLTAPQVKRLREITLQAAGPRSLLDKVVATKVGMSNAEYTKFVAAIREGDQQVAKIKSQVSEKVRAKYKDVKQPTDQKTRNELNAKIQKDLSTEMKKHEAEMQKIINTSESKTAAIVKKEYLERLKALMGKPFANGKPATSPSSKPAPKPPAKKG